MPVSHIVPVSGEFGKQRSLPSKDSQFDQVIAGLDCYLGGACEKTPFFCEIDGIVSACKAAWGEGKTSTVMA
jgi:hypothetical protein